jgi:hypothetical protein
MDAGGVSLFAQCQSLAVLLVMTVHAWMMHPGTHRQRQHLDGKGVRSATRT